MQVRPVFTQVDTGFLYGNSVVCGQTCRSDARSAGGEYTGFLARRTLAARLKSAKNLYFEYRFFDEIRQIHRFFYIFRQNLQNL